MFKRAILFFLICLSIFTVTFAAEYKYQLSICTIFQNESRFMREWIEYHRLVGVEHFYLYDNKSTDNFREILEPYIQKGIVELEPWPPLGIDEWGHWPVDVQPAAYLDAISRSKGISKWLAILDADEFILPLAAESISGTLENHFSSSSGVFIRWLMFGTGDVAEIKAGELSIEKLVRCSHPLHEWNFQGKSIVRPELVEDCQNPHHCVYPQGKSHDYAPREMLRINHYWTRDEKNLLEVKIPRYQIWNVQTSQHKDEESCKMFVLDMASKFNDNINIDICRFVPRLNESINMRKSECLEQLRY